MYKALDVFVKINECPPAHFARTAQKVFLTARSAIILFINITAKKSLDLTAGILCSN
jgi:hypothetical protein